MIGTPLSSIDISAKNLKAKNRASVVERIHIELSNLSSPTLDYYYYLGSLSNSGVQSYQKFPSLRIIGQCVSEKNGFSMFDILFANLTMSVYDSNKSSYGFFLTDTQHKIDFIISYEDSSYKLYLMVKGTNQKQNFCDIDLFVFGSRLNELVSSPKGVTEPPSTIIRRVSQSSYVYELSKLGSSFTIDEITPNIQPESASLEVSSLDTNPSQNMQNAENQNLEMGGVIDSLSLVMLLLSLNPKTERRPA